jgi:hypothetical protein
VKNALHSRTSSKPNEWRLTSDAMDVCYSKLTRGLRGPHGKTQTLPTPLTRALSVYVGGRVGVMAVLHTCGSNLSYLLHERLANKIPDIPEYDVSTCFHEFLTGMPKKKQSKI